MKAAYIETPGTAREHFRSRATSETETLRKPGPRPRQGCGRQPDRHLHSLGGVPEELPSPFVVGCDLAGVVEGVGPEVTKLELGDRVWGSNQGLLGRQGTFADYAAADEYWLYPMPEDVPERDAAAWRIGRPDGHLGLFRDALLKVGETVSSTAAAAGSLVRRANGQGNRGAVMTTAGNDEKTAMCRRSGAAAVVNHKTGDLDAAISKFGPINVWWENLREPNLERAVEHLAPRSRIILMAGRDAPLSPSAPST